LHELGNESKDLGEIDPGLREVWEGDSDRMTGTVQLYRSCGFTFAGPKLKLWIQKN